MAAAALSMGTVAGARSVKGQFLDPRLSSEERVADLLPRMTLEEKVGQLLCSLGWEMYTIKGAGVEPSDKFKELVANHHAGMLWAVYRADPWTRKTLENGLNPRLAAMAGNALQKYVIENTRLGIPVFIAEEAPHGHMAIGGTVFPTGIGMAATWSRPLLERVGQAIGQEVRTQGAHISYGPVLDLTRDPRWSRVEETYGEDPVLSGTLGAAIVTGLGGGDLSKPYSTIATLKHFLGYAVPEAGQNGNYSVVGQRDLLQNFLPPFHDAIEAGALSVMSSYNSIDGVPCTSNKELLTGVLHDQWHFKGFTVSDLYSIEGICETHLVTPDMQGAAIAALEAGMDVDLGGDAYRNLVSAVREGKVDEKLIDRAAGRVLKHKFDMGLFDNPYVDPDKAAATVNSAEHKALALDVARASVTLLENRNSTLPLSKKIGKVAVIGPNADTGYNQLGDYTAPQPDENVTTVLEGVREVLSPEQVVYVKGCAIRDTSGSDIEGAVKAAADADAIIAVVGGSSARDFKTTYKETGAAIVDEKSISDMESGEGYDRATLTLMGDQHRLLEALRATGKPLIVVYIEGRPLSKTWAAENADALLTAYYPGQEGGRAIADVIFGDYNPAGRLPVTTPRSEGQIPIYYNRRAPKLHDYVELTARPQYVFGYGLSYTTFDYSDLKILRKGDAHFSVSFTLTNTGNVDGEEVPQLYLHDKVASVAQPLKQLKAYDRVMLRAGESKTVTFDLLPSAFSLVNLNYETVVEAGDFELTIGRNSDDAALTGIITVE